MKPKVTAAPQAFHSIRRRSLFFQRTQKSGVLGSNASLTGCFSHTLPLLCACRHACCSGRSIACPTSQFPGRSAQVTTPLACMLFLLFLSVEYNDCWPAMLQSTWRFLLEGEGSDDSDGMLLLLTAARSCPLILSFYCFTLCGFEV
jgi:hypothetical protein